MKRRMQMTVRLHVPDDPSKGLLPAIVLGKEGGDKGPYTVNLCDIGGGLVTPKIHGSLGEEKLRHRERGLCDFCAIHFGWDRPPRPSHPDQDGFRVVPGQPADTLLLA